MISQSSEGISGIISQQAADARFVLPRLGDAVNVLPPPLQLADVAYAHLSSSPVTRRISLFQLLHDEEEVDLCAHPPRCGLGGHVWDD
jgi:hypothetical protein